MSSIKLKEYKIAIAAAMQETRKAIEEAVELIRNHEDGPATMQAALADIEERLSNVESEVSCMEYSYENMLSFIARLNDQRDLAIKQRNIALRQLKIEQQKNEDFKLWSYPAPAAMNNL